MSGRLALALGVVATVAMVLARNNDVLPVPACQAASHCLPGETCRRGRCHGAASLVLHVHAPAAHSRHVAPVTEDAVRRASA